MTQDEKDAMIGGVEPNHYPDKKNLVFLGLILIPSILIEGSLIAFYAGSKATLRPYSNLRLGIVLTISIISIIFGIIKWRKFNRLEKRWKRKFRLWLILHGRPVPYYLKVESLKFKTRKFKHEKPNEV